MHRDFLLCCVCSLLVFPEVMSMLCWPVPCCFAGQSCCTACTSQATSSFRQEQLTVRSVPLENEQSDTCIMPTHPVVPSLHFRSCNGLSHQIVWCPRLVPGLAVPPVRSLLLAYDHRVGCGCGPVVGATLLIIWSWRGEIPLMALSNQLRDVAQDVMWARGRLVGLLHRSVPLLELALHGGWCLSEYRVSDFTVGPWCGLSCIWVGGAALHSVEGISEFHAASVFREGMKLHGFPACW